MIPIRHIPVVLAWTVLASSPAWAQNPPVPPAPPAAPTPPAPPPGKPFVFVPPISVNFDATEALYDRARDAIEQRQYERAMAQFDRLIEGKTARTDAAMYWKAYVQSKVADRTAALATLAALQKDFAKSRWVKDARALEMEIRQAAGQPVNAESQNDEELKLLALRGLMQSDPEKTVPILERMLTGSNSLRVKDRALFVLSQSRSPRAREVIVAIAKGNDNPDLQLKAIQYLGVLGTVESRDVLAEIYRTSSDIAVKRAILRSYMTLGERDRLAALAKSEQSVELRTEAVRQLGAMGAGAALADLYQTETSPEVKKRILHGMAMGGGSDRLIAIVKSEKDPDLRKTAIQSLGMTRRAGSTEALTSLYASDNSREVKEAVIQALSIQQQAKALVDLARSEKNPELKKTIVSKLATMRSQDSTDYLLELLK